MMVRTWDREGADAFCFRDIAIGVRVIPDMRHRVQRHILRHRNGIEQTSVRAL